jgi:hypothetical protein
VLSELVQSTAEVWVFHMQACAVRQELGVVITGLCSIVAWGCMIAGCIEQGCSASGLVSWGQQMLKNAGHCLMGNGCAAGFARSPLYSTAKHQHQLLWQALGEVTNPSLHALRGSCRSQPVSTCAGGGSPPIAWLRATRAATAAPMTLGMLLSSKPGMPSVNLNTATSNSSSPSPPATGHAQDSTCVLRAGMDCPQCGSNMRRSFDFACYE